MLAYKVVQKFAGRMWSVNENVDSIEDALNDSRVVEYKIGETTYPKQCSLQVLFACNTLAEAVDAWKFYSNHTTNKVCEILEGEAEDAVFVGYNHERHPAVLDRYLICSPVPILFCSAFTPTKVVTIPKE